MAQHEWKVERPKKNGEDPDLVCLNCGLLQLPENKDTDCVPSQAWVPKPLRTCDDDA